MQQLFAKEYYGGAPEGQNFEGWCARGVKAKPVRWDGSLAHYYSDDPDAWGQGTGVAFDTVDYIFGESLDSRFLLGCFNKSFCSYGLEDTTIQSGREEPSDADTRDGRKSRGTGEILLNVTDDVITHDSAQAG